MAARRLLIVLLVLLGISTLAAALVPVQRPGEREDEEAGTPSATPRQTPRKPTGELIRERIDAAKVGKEPQRIELAPGDQLQLTVVAAKPDQVAIPDLGELADVGPDTPAVFDLLADAPGEYPVRLVEADRELAVLTVVPRPASERSQPAQSERDPARASPANEPLDERTNR